MSEFNREIQTNPGTSCEVPLATTGSKPSAEDRTILKADDSRKQQDSRNVLPEMHITDAPPRPTFKQQLDLWLDTEHKTLTKPIEEMTQILLDRFGGIDKDNNGYLSPPELNLAARNRSISPDVVNAIATVRQFQDDIQELSDDEVLDEAFGVTREDIGELNKQSNASAEALLDGCEEAFCALQLMNQLDEDANGFITDKEFGAWISRNSQSDLAEPIARLSAKTREASLVAPDVPPQPGVTARDLDGWAHSRENKNIEAIRMAFRDAQRRTARHREAMTAKRTP